MKNRSKLITHQNEPANNTFGVCSISGCSRDGENLVERVVNGDVFPQSQCRLHTFAHQKVIKGPGPK